MARDPERLGFEHHVRQIQRKDPDLPVVGDLDFLVVRHGICGPYPAPMERRVVGEISPFKLFEHLYVSLDAWSGVVAVRDFAGDGAACCKVEVFYFVGRAAMEVGRAGVEFARGPGSLRRPDTSPSQSEMSTVSEDADRNEISRTGLPPPTYTSRPPLDASFPGPNIFFATSR